MVVLTQDSRDYLLNKSGKNNYALYPFVKDYSNRILLTLDHVVAVVKTDENVELFIRGRIRKIDEFHRLVFIEPHPWLIKKGFEPGWHDAKKVIRLPNNTKNLYLELLSFFQSINNLQFQQPLHINNKLIK